MRNPDREKFLREVTAVKSPEEKNSLLMKTFTAEKTKEDKKK